MKVVKTENYNTNNDWGFGGVIGVETTYDNGLITRNGQAHFRHLRPTDYFKVYVEFEGDRIEVADFASYKEFKSLEKVSIYKNETALTARAGDADEVEVGYHGMAKRVHTITINH